MTPAWAPLVFKVELFFLNFRPYESSVPVTGRLAVSSLSGKARRQPKTTLGGSAN